MQRDDAKPRADAADGVRVHIYTQARGKSPSAADVCERACFRSQDVCLREKYTISCSLQRSDADRRVDVILDTDLFSAVNLKIKNRDLQLPPLYYRYLVPEKIEFNVVLKTYLISYLQYGQDNFCYVYNVQGSVFHK